MILKVKDLSKSYSGKKVVNGLSFNVRAGQVVGLLGPNGAGKTTAFYMAIGLIHPDSGSVFFNDSDVTSSPVHTRAQMGMGYLAQEPSIFRQLTVEQNILCILETLPITRQERKRRLEELLEELHLTPHAKKRATTLSGGERRRLEITRSLVTNPRLLLLDEPFANIDPLTIYDVKQMIRHLTSKNISVLITDHNAREVSSIVDHSYLIQEGRVTHSGTIADLLTSKDARSTYFGEDFEL
ncbi:LPS export ABC transporter ATP-binding protein [Candidatus Neptunichlamydia sp. REUL1]|uniref:LPS export ABC transporter ATP-binding protein n=1 Tax=Candidatus Neptunichlamydia sp. REUL1 TaxID=3064277 RepID=UPI00293124FB|nr:LPS export ABC transporter ATP-binding protein [Candidatus Neptunochlamydia sp. REUL1]